MDRGEEPTNWSDLCQHSSESYLDEAVKLADDWLHQDDDQIATQSEGTGRSDNAAHGHAPMESPFSPVPSARKPGLSAEDCESVLIPVPPANSAQRQCQINGSEISPPRSCPSGPMYKDWRSHRGDTSVGSCLHGGSQGISEKATLSKSSTGTEAPLGVLPDVLPCLRPVKRKQLTVGRDVPSLKLQERIDLHSLGLRRSEHIANQKSTKRHKAHVTFGTRVRKLISMYALVSTVHYDMPSHQLAPDSTFFQRTINRLDEVNELVDGTLNEMSCFALVTDISSNESYTLSQAVKQDDWPSFVEAMAVEVKAHEDRGHWTMVPRSSLPLNAKPIKAIWSFKRKRFPDGRLNKHKARLCAHGGMQRWGQNYWETYSPVVNSLTVKVLLVIAKLHNLDSKSIDFVLAFPQADLDTDIWMEIPPGFEADDERAVQTMVLQLKKNLQLKGTC